MRSACWLSSVVAAVALTAAGADDEKGKGKAPPGKGERRDPAQIFSRLDRNGDGVLTEDELADVPERLRDLLKRADKNGDGKITRDELMSAMPGGGPGAGKGKGQPTREMIERRFKEMDADHDGKISRDEAKGMVKQNFDRLDKNGDGFVTLDEMSSFRPMGDGAAKGKGRRPDRAKAPPSQSDGSSESKTPESKPTETKSKEAKSAPAKRRPPAGAGDGMADSLFDRMDRNHDGKISREEADGRIKESFDRLDYNKDGFVSKEEFQRAFETMRRMGAGPGGPGGPPRKPVDIFNEQDADGDGRVTRAEAKGVLAEKFDEFDADKDGKLTRQEVEVGFKKMEAAKK